MKIDPAAEVLPDPAGDFGKADIKRSAADTHLWQAFLI
jgi:hypothetical protein